MRGVNRLRNSLNRAVLSDSGIVIKDQQLNGNASFDDIESVGSSAFETASLISCVTCLSDTGDKHDVGNNSSLLLPSNTVIPYGKILAARYIDEPRGNGISTTNSYTDDPFSDDNRQSSSSPGLPQDVGSSHLVEITFAKPRRNDLVPKKVTLSIDSLASSSTDVVEEILDRSYKSTKRNKSILVIINPHGGKGRANKLYVSKAKPILIASHCTVEILETTYHRHAIDIAQNIDIDKYDVIACASGDGIPHEVLNGLYRRADRAKAFNKVAITQLPCGSGNAMSVSCHGTSNPSHAALSLVKSLETRIDIMCCSQSSYVDQPRLSFLSQTYGVIAESDINTEFIRWMGPARFELGVTVNVLQRKRYPCDIYVKYAAKSKNELRNHYIYHKDRLATARTTKTDSEEEEEDIKIDESSFQLKYPLDEPIPADWEKIDPDLADNIGIFYTGKMPYIAADTKFFPAALPDDGTMDLVLTDARTSITRMAPILLSLDKGYHVLQPEVQHSKILAYKLVPKVKQSVISVDGENFPYEPLQVEILPRLCKTLLKTGSYVETNFDSM